MKFSLILLLAISLSACGKINKVEADYTGYSKVCIAGVTYLQFSSGVTIQRNTNDLIVRCNE